MLLIGKARMKSVSRVVGAVAVLLVIGALACLFVRRSRPVVWSYRELGDPSGEPSRAFFNPFRDRSPERVAGSLLRCVSRGETQKAIAQVGRAGARDEVVALTSHVRLRSWRLANRTDSPGSVELFYWTRWGTSSSWDTPVWVSVQRSLGVVPWRVVGFRSW